MPSKRNLGPSINCNKYIKHSNGQFIAGVCCDDGFLPEKLTTQLNEFENDPKLGAVFTLPSLIDENNNPLPNESSPIFFNKNFNSRFEFLRYFFFNCNFLLGPSMMIKKSCYDKVGLYDPRLLQLQDFEMYIRLCLAGYELKLIEEPLTYYRIRDNKQNPHNVMNEYLSPSSSATSGNLDSFDFVSNGFKIRNDNNAWNGSGNSYIFMAFAESPFVNSNGVPTNAR